jgi:hypothetical protein
MGLSLLPLHPIRWNIAVQVLPHLHITTRTSEKCGAQM